VDFNFKGNDYPQILFSDGHTLNELINCKLMEKETKNTIA
jgi:hypothetical protein